MRGGSGSSGRRGVGASEVAGNGWRAILRCGRASRPVDGVRPLVVRDGVVRGRGGEEESVGCEALIAVLGVRYQGDGVMG